LRQAQHRRGKLRGNHVERDDARNLRELVRYSHILDIQGELRELAARFERMAVYYEAQRTNARARAANLDQDLGEGRTWSEQSRYTG
jgi:hypothetical protein